MTLEQDHIEHIIVGDIIAERRRQDAKWGAARQHQPAVWSTILSEENGEVAEAALDIQFFPESATVEMYRHLREELVQVAAVAMAAIEDLDRHDLKYDHLPVLQASQIVHQWHEQMIFSPESFIRKRATLKYDEEEGYYWTVAKVNGVHTKLVGYFPAPEV